MYTQVLTFGAAFLGSAVESVEALTIVLAVGLTRGWRSPLYGTLVALVSLAVLVAVFGQLIVTRVPESYLKLIIGALIVLFGLRWLHKAVLRSAGVIPMHDEDKSYAATVSELQGTVARQDWIGFTIALKGVFLEGLEVVFIVVAAIGLVVRKPLAQVPENTLKYAVGIILTSLGTFWAAEGMGATWPLDFISVFAIAAIYFGASRVAVTLVSHRTAVKV